MTSLKLLGICGSLRKASINLAALNTAASLMPDGMTFQVASIGDLPLYDEDLQAQGWPESVERLKREIDEADALLIASPEYNFGVAAPLKNAIDWLSRYKDQPFRWKPTAIFSATAGPTGGGRSQHDLRRVLASVEAMVMIKPEVYIGACMQKFDREGNCTDELTRRFLRDQMAAFADWTVRTRRFVAAA